MNSTTLAFTSVQSVILAYSILRRHGIDCAINGKTLRFHNDTERNLAYRLLTERN